MTARATRLLWTRECEWCGEDYPNRRALPWKEWNRRRYCSRHCAREAEYENRPKAPAPPTDVLACINRVRAIIEKDPIRG